MEDIASIAMLITLASSILRAFPRLSLPRSKKAWSGGAKFLFVFGLVVLAFGAFSAYRYWPLIKERDEQVMLAVWLLVTMLFGTIVQVLASNHRAGRDLLDLSATQLIVPMLFAPIVFYPIWTIAASSPSGPFSFYAAFLNGYFWESVVSTVKGPIAPPSAPSRDGQP